MPNQRRIVLIIGVLSAIVVGAVWFSGCGGGGGAATPTSAITLASSVNKSPSQTGSVDLFGTVPSGTDHIIAELPGSVKVPGTITANPPALPATITPKALVKPAEVVTPGQWYFRLTLPTGASNVIIHAYNASGGEIGTALTISLTNSGVTATAPTITIDSSLGSPDGNGLQHVTGTCSTSDSNDKIAVWRNGSEPPSETSSWMSAASPWAADVQVYPGTNLILAQAFHFIGGSASASDPNNYVASAVVSTTVTWSAGAPTASITSPAAATPPTVYSDPAGAVSVVVAYAANVAANSPAVNKVEVRFYAQGTTAPAWVSSSAANTANSKCVDSLSSSPVTVPIVLTAKGVNVIEAQAIAGYGTSTLSSVTVDFEPPVTAPTITSPATASSTVTSTTLELRGTISQDANASPVTKMQYQLNGSGTWIDLGAPASGTGTNVAWGPFNITLGTFSNAIQVRGFTTVGGAAASVQVYCNPAPPAPVITSPTSPSATYTSAISLTVTAAKATLDGTNPDLSDIAYSVNNGTTWSSWIPLTGSSPYTINNVALAAGPNTVVVKTRTGTGGTTATQTESAVSASLAETYNSPNPAPTLTSPVDGSTSAATAGITITGSATKGTYGGTIATIQYGYGTDASTPPTSWNNMPSGNVTMSGTTANFTLTVAPPSRNNFLFVQSVDSNTHASVGTVERRVYWNPPPLTPVITTTAATVNNQTLSLAFTGGPAAAPSDATAPNMYATSINGGTTWSAWMALTGNSPWTVNVNLVAGSNSVMVKTQASDATLPAMTATASSPSAAVAFTYNSPAGAPVVTSPANNSTVITAAAFVNVVGTAAKSTGGAAIDGIKYATGTSTGATGTWTDISTLATYTFTPGATTANWSAAIPLTSAQTWLYFRATASGQSGDSTAVPGLHVYWNPPPTVTITGAPALVNDVLVNTYTPSGTWAPANPPSDHYAVSNIQLKLGSVTQNVTPTNGGTWTATSAFTLATGVNVITAQAQVVATGVTTANSTIQTLTVYYNPVPTVAWVSPAAGTITSNAMVVSATQTGGRGIDGVEYSLNGGTSWSVLQTTKNLSGQYTFSPTLALGSNTVTVKAVSGSLSPNPGPEQDSAAVSRTFTYQPPPTITLAQVDDTFTATSAAGVIYANVAATLSNTIGVTAVNFTSSPAGTTYDTISVPAAQQGLGTPVTVYGRIDLRTLGTTVVVTAASVGNVGTATTPVSITNNTSTTRALYVQDIKGTGSQTLYVMLDPTYYNTVGSVGAKLVFDSTKVTVNDAGVTLGSGVPAASSTLFHAGTAGTETMGILRTTGTPYPVLTGPQVFAVPVTIAAGTSGARFYVSFDPATTGVADRSNNDLTSQFTLVEGMIRLP